MQRCHSVSIAGVHLPAFGQQPDDFVGVEHVNRIGCGTGRVAEQALRDFPAAEFILADPSKAMRVQTRGRLTNRDSARLTILPPIGNADLEAHVANSPPM